MASLLLFGSFDMLKTKLALALPLALITLVGCSSSDNRYEPVEAPEVANVLELNEYWNASTGGVGSYYSELAAAFDRAHIYVAGREGEVSALDKTTGSRLWSIDLSSEPENDEKDSARLSGGVALYGAMLVVGSENGYVYALNSGDGTLLWKYYLGSEVVAKPAFNASGHKLFVLDSQGNFTCLDASSGSKLWVTGDATLPLRLRAQANPLTVGDEYVLVGTSTGRVNVLLQENGATVNQINVGEAIGTNALERIADVSASPLILGNVLYAAAFSGGLVEYDFGTFNYLARLGYQTSRDLGFDQDSIVLTSDDGSVTCINRADNSQRWVNTQLSYRNVTAPVVFGDYAAVGDYEGYLYLMDMSDGSIDYMIEADSSGFYTQGQVSEGKLYVIARDGTLMCFGFADQGKAQQALAVEQSNDALLANAAQGLTLNHPGVYNAGIYAPAAMTQEQLEARRAAIKRAVAQQEAQMAAQRRAAQEAAKARAEYEAQRKAYEEERRERLSGFGIAPGVRADMDE